MRTTRYLLTALAILGTCLLLSGCGKAIGGPRFYWDDQQRERLADNYTLPPLTADTKEENAVENPAVDAAKSDAKPATPAKAAPADNSGAGAVPRGKM